MIQRAPLVLLLASALGLVVATLPGSHGGFAGGLGGFGSLSELSELPEDMFEEEPSITGKDILAGASKPNNSNNNNNNNNMKKQASATTTTAAGIPVAAGMGLGGIGFDSVKAEAAWRAVRATTAKAFLPSLATAAAGAAVATLQRRYGQRVVRLLSEQRERAKLRREKARLEKEIRREQRRYEKEMRSMMEEAAHAQQRLGGDASATEASAAEKEEEMEGKAEDEDALQHQQQLSQVPQRPPGMDVRAYVGQLEETVQALKSEVATRGAELRRAQAAKEDELGSARAVVEQLRRELEAARHARTQLQEQLEAVMQRATALKEMAARAEAQAQQAQQAAGGQVPEEERERIRAEARAALQSEMEQAVAEARASASKEARHQVVTELREKLQRERSKFEADIVDLYRRRLKEEVGKRDAAMEERLRAQDVEYRGQCEELRVKVQQILKDRDAQMREKVAMHAREWQEKVAGKGSRNDKQQQPPQRQQQPPRPTGRRPVAGGRPAEKHQPAFAPYPQQPPPAWEHQAGDAAYHPNQPQPQQQRPQRRGAGPVGREGEGRYPAPGMSRRERV